MGWRPTGTRWRRSCATATRRASPAAPWTRRSCSPRRRWTPSGRDLAARAVRSYSARSDGWVRGRALTPTLSQGGGRRDEEDALPPTLSQGGEEEGRGGRPHPDPLPRGRGRRRTLAPDAVSDAAWARPASWPFARFRHTGQGARPRALTGAPLLATIGSSRSNVRHSNEVGRRCLSSPSWPRRRRSRAGGSLPPVRAPVRSGRRADPGGDLRAAVEAGRQAAV